MFSTVLIADRGEIVMRIARTCERLGIRTLAVHTREEASAVYLSACDAALPLDCSSIASLDPAALIALAQQHGAQAIHPGVSARTHDAGFAAAVREAGLGWIGPAPEISARLADDLAYCELARETGIRALPACAVDADKPAEAIESATLIGYPLIVRARSSASDAVIVESDDELLPALSQVRDATGSSALRIEHRLDRPRMLSVQVAWDGAEAVALVDAEHSLVQDGRRVLEEAPAPALSGARGEQRRVVLREAGVRIASEAGLLGTSVIEFQLDAANQIYLCGIRAGLLLDHPLAEMCTRLDVVELQIRIASGERLPDSALRVQQTGHAIQARLYATTDAPTEGGTIPELVTLRWPMLAPGRLRVESDLLLGARPAIDVDPLVARVIGYGPTRHQAVLALDRALAEATLEPLNTNLQHIRDLIADDSFRAGQFDCDFVARAVALPTTHT